MSEIFSVSSSPHIRSKLTTNNIMAMVILALMPATIFGIINFGIRALIIIILTVGTCVLTEFLYQYFMKKKVTISDGSAAVTGLLLALNLPAGVPYWMPVLGGVFAILIVKQIYGGLGQNFMNPALAARCFLIISFAGIMTDFTYTGSLASIPDTISRATPLELLKAGEEVDILSLFLRTTAGTIGETSALALIIGGIFLIVIKAIDFIIPLSYILTVAVFTAVFGGQGFDITYILGNLFGGGLMLGAFFMATDYVTSPITRRGKLIFGIIIGLFTGIFRIFGGSAEGVSYAIIIGNILVPLIERVSIPPAFGEGRMKYE